MGKKIRKYPTEFKKQALEMLATGGYTMAALERELGITPGLLKQWRRVAEHKGKYGFMVDQHLSLEAAQEKIQHLERENARLRQEQEILKKAMAIFSKPRQ